MLVGGEKLIRAVERMLAGLRPAMIAHQLRDAGDAEVVESALAGCLASIQEAEGYTFTN